MRACPVCEGALRVDFGNYMNGFHLFACACGMRYLDHPDANQKDLNDYYRNDTSADLQTQDTYDRLSNLNAILPTGKGLDIGGTWSQLAKMRTLDTANAGQIIENDYDYVVISHTLEHVYDVPGMMRTVFQHLNSGGKVFIEVPFWESYDLPDYDFYWQHLNKFTPIHLKRLLIHHGFTVLVSTQLADFREFKCWRIMGGK